MLRIQSRIVHKALILLAVPLIFELIVATTLICLQHYYGEAVKVEAHRKQVVNHVNEFWYFNMNMTTNLLANALIKGSHHTHFREKSQQVVEQYESLEKLLSQDPYQLNRLRQIMACHIRIRGLCDQLIPTLSGSAGSISQILSLRRNISTWKRLTAVNIETGNLIRSFREYELLQSANATAKVRGIALVIQIVLAGVIIGSAVIAYLLFRYFMRGIHSSVQTLTQNIQRFKRAEPLPPAIEGTDEIALLDAQFHDVADQVAAAQRMKQAFITTISSDLRVPICSTREYLTELAGGSVGVLPEEATVRAQKSVTLLDRLIGLLNDLLALQATGISRMEILPRMCSLQEVIQTSIDSVSALAEKNGISLKCQNEQVSAYADPDRIVQVLVNLLSNAIKFSQPGSTVEVDTCPVGNQVEIRVKDTGRGIPADMRDAVFQRFQQVAASDATEKGGTGLGLPICKDIVERHGGTIGVESEEGKGSTFWFRLPVSARAEGQASSAAAGVVAPERAGRTRPSRGKGLSIVPRTIYAKGLILVSVPLVIELALGMAMFSLQRYYEARLNRERVVVETLFHANEMWNNCAEIMISQGQYILFNGPQPSLAASIAQFHDEHRFLQKLVAHDPLRQRELEEIHTCLWRALGLCDQLRPLESVGQSVSEKMRVLMSDIAVASRAFNLVFSVEEKMHRFGSPDRKKGKLKYLDRTAAVAEVDKATALVDQVVLGSLAASTLVAVLLFLYFVRSINKGLNAVVENTERFERGEELKPAVEEGDELAQVDAALYEMAEEIREAQRTKQTILSTISHDLRSPLTAVLGYFSLLSAGAFGDTPAAAVTVAQKCEKDVLQLIRLINDLLDLDKIESGKLSLRPKTLSVKKVIERAISTVIALADERGVTVQGEAVNGEIYADPDRIVQAVANLLSSAVTLSPEGSSVDASAIEHNGAVEIRVTSTGASTASDLLNAQFDRYQRREHGLRLELPISKELIKLHGGTVGAISEKGACTFWCSLPSPGSSDHPV